MTIVRSVRERLPEGCFARKIKKGRCSLSLRSAPTERLLVDLDRRGAPIGDHEERCDYLFFAQVKEEKDWVAPIELKGGAVKASEVEGQLQSGARVIERLIPEGATVHFVPIVAGTCHTEELRRLGLRKLVFRGTQTRIKLRPCNSPLVEAFGR